MPLKIHIQSPCQSNNVDGPVDHILRHLPPENKASSIEQCDVVIVPITHFNWFKFSDENMDKVRGKKWVLMDYSEFGWDWDQETSYLWGDVNDIDTHRIGRFSDSYEKMDEWSKFNSFFIGNPPILTFQRELLQKDRTDKLIPIEYTSHLQELGAQTNEEFLKRPLDVSYYWGRSSEDRVVLQAEIFHLAAKRGFDVLTQFNYFHPAVKDCESSKKWLAVFAPHYSRLDVNEVQTIIRQSKVTIVMPGCGVKTFRHGESCGDAIMAMPGNNLAWSYPWIAGENCLNLGDLKELHDNLQDSTMLCNIYREAMENARNYRIDTYLRRWVVGNIEQHV